MFWIILFLAAASAFCAQGAIPSHSSWMPYAVLLGICSIYFIVAIATIEIKKFIQERIHAEAEKTRRLMFATHFHVLTPKELEASYKSYCETEFFKGPPQT